jgi:hypothetical protein
VGSEFSGLTEGRCPRQAGGLCDAEPKAHSQAEARVLGAAGLLSLAGGASAATAPVADLPSQKTAPNHEIILGEEELSDVSLSTFYIFD